MSAKSRGRHRFDVPDEPALSVDEQAEINEAVDALELADINPKAGISKWVGAALGARDRAKAERETEKPAENMPGIIPEEPIGLREPTPFERAVLGGMARKPMYGGTVEPWRVDMRRRRNRAARKSRRANRLAAR